MEIRDWMEASAENKRIFMKEHKLFSAILLQDKRRIASVPGQSRLRTLLKSDWLRVAAIVLITLSLNAVYQHYVAENKKLATIYAPRTGKASLRQTASSKGTLLKNCKAGTIVSVLAIGNGYTRINYKGTVGYIKTACLKFYGDSESTAHGVLSYKGNTGGGTRQMRFSYQYGVRVYRAARHYGALLRAA